MMPRWMFIFGLLSGAFAAEPHRIVLLQELVPLQAMERKTVVVFPLEQQGAQLEVKFASKRGGEGVRMAVYERGSNQPLAATEYELSDTLRLPLTRQHEYRVEIENLRQRLGNALIDIEVTLIFGARLAPAASSGGRTLDPQRRLYTIVASLALFVAMCVYSAVRLTPPLLARWRGER